MTYSSVDLARFRRAEAALQKLCAQLADNVVAHLNMFQNADTHTSWERHVCDMALRDRVSVKEAAAKFLADQFRSLIFVPDADRIHAPDLEEINGEHHAV